MNLVTAFLMTLATVVSPDVVSVLDVPPIDPDCAPPKVCATLYFYDAAGQPLGALQGTEKVLKVKNVAKVQQIGSGSYTVFKGKNHRLDKVGLSRIVLIFPNHQGTQCMSARQWHD